MKSKTCFCSIDVEHDRGETQRRFQGVKNLNLILDIFKRHGMLATLFVTGEVLEKHLDLVKEWSSDYEIACHSYSHKFWNTLNQEERKNELENYQELYQRVFNKKPVGFRAPSHIIDEQGTELLENQGFLYDSSVVPHYPPFKTYRGYKGRAPLLPYYPKGRRILEIPVRGQVFGLPLAGAWISKLPLLFYQILFSVYSPEFVTLNMHSWDCIDFPGRKTPPGRFLKNLDSIIRLLKDKGYQFSNGEQILKNRE